MDARLLELSAKFRTTKFVKCKASDAIKNYPDHKCPTVLVYQAGKVLKQFVGLSSFGATNPSVGDVEWALSRVHAVDSQMLEAPRADAKRFNMRRL